MLSALQGMGTGGVTVVVPTDNTEPGKNYLETLTDVYHYSQSAGIPYKFILLDSWCVIALSLPCVASLMRRWMRGAQVVFQGRA